MLEKVKVYDCEVRHGGNLLHSIPRQAATQREIKLLRHIHGDDAVVGVKEVGESAINTEEELYELAVRYSKTSNPAHGRRLVENVFHVELTRFPQFLADRDALAEMDRQERRFKAQAEAVRFSSAREAAEARVRADMAAEKVQQGQAQPRAA